MDEVVKTIISKCTDQKSNPSFNPHIFTDLSFLRMDCLAEHLIRASITIREPLDVIATLRLLKIELKNYIYINEFDENLIALKNKFKKEYSNSLPEFKMYFRENLTECENCWNRNSDKHRTVRTYLATILLIHAASILLNGSEETILTDETAGAWLEKFLEKFLPSIR